MPSRGTPDSRLSSTERVKVAAVEEVRVCRACGHIDPADSRGRCPACDVFFELAIVPRPQAEAIARQHRHRALRRRLIRLSLVLVAFGGLTIWALGAYLDLGPSPPRATTSVNADVGPQTWAQIGRTPDNSGFTPEMAPFPHRVAWTYRTAKPLLASPAIADSHVYLSDRRWAYRRSRSADRPTDMGVSEWLALQFQPSRGRRGRDFRHTPRAASCP